MISHHPIKFADHEHCGNGDIMVSILSRGHARPRDRRVG